MNILFALPGLHRVKRGAEIAFEAVASQIAGRRSHSVTMLGCGPKLEGRNYKYDRITALKRERFEAWPKLPFLRDEFMYEDLTFAAGLMFHPARVAADVTVTCSYPYTNWALRSPRMGTRPRAPHVFVTQNGDWATSGTRGEPRFFSCEGLICTNPLYEERNRERWRTALIPNGVDTNRFIPGPGSRRQFGLPPDRPIVLMVSALDSIKRVADAVRALAAVREAFVVIAGDGPLRAEVDRLCAELLPGRFIRRTFTHEEMPDLYRSADLFLHIRIREPFGNVYVEALSSGIAILAHDDEVTRWILRDYATLIDTTSVSVLTEAIQSELSRPAFDRTPAAEWARSTYDWSVIAGRYAEFFQTVRDRHS